MLSAFLSQICILIEIDCSAKKCQSSGANLLQFSQLFKQHFHNFHNFFYRAVSPSRQSVGLYGLYRVDSLRLIDEQL